MSYTTVG